MHAIRAAGDRHIRPRIDEQLGSRRVLSHCANRIPRQRLQFTAIQVFFPQLNEIHSTASSFHNLMQQSALPGDLAPGKLPAVGDVVEQQNG